MRSRLTSKAAIISLCIASLPVASFAIESNDGYLAYGMGQLKTPYRETLQYFNVAIPYKAETQSLLPSPFKIGNFQPQPRHENGPELLQRRYSPLVVRPIQVSGVINTAPVVYSPPPVVAPPTVVSLVAPPPVNTPPATNLPPPVVNAAPPVITPPVIAAPPAIAAPPVIVPPAIFAPPVIAAPPAQAPEIDPASALAALTLLFGTIAVLRGRRAARLPLVNL